MADGFGSQVELSVSCSELVNMDAFSLSDPLVVVYSKTGAAWEELGRTEMIKDNLNPHFVRSFKTEYRFEEMQREASFSFPPFPFPFRAQGKKLTPWPPPQCCASCATTSTT